LGAVFGLKGTDESGEGSLKWRRVCGVILINGLEELRRDCGAADDLGNFNTRIVEERSLSRRERDPN
jgi:hypothetical protein